MLRTALSANSLQSGKFTLATQHSSRVSSCRAPVSPAGSRPGVRRASELSNIFQAPSLANRTESASRPPQPAPAPRLSNPQPPARGSARDRAVTPAQVRSRAAPRVGTTPSQDGPPHAPRPAPLTLLSPRESRVCPRSPADRGSPTDLTTLQQPGDRHFRPPPAGRK